MDQDDVHTLCLDFHGKCSSCQPPYTDFQEKLKEREREFRKRKEREEHEMERVRLKVRRKEAVASFQALLVETIKGPQVKYFLSLMI